MTDDERFERDLASVVREAAPVSAPSSLRRRVDAAMARPAASASRRWSPVLAATAAAAILLAVALVGPQLVHPPGQSAGSSAVTTGDASPRASISQVSVPPASTNPSAVTLPEPVTHPGNVQIGSLLTPADGYVVNTDGRLLVTHSGGAAWRDVTPSDTVTEQLSPFFLDPTHGWVSGFDRNGDPGLHIWRTTDAGLTWTHTVVMGVREGNWALEFLSPAIGWLATDPGGGQRPQPELRWTSDGGATWSSPVHLTAATGVPTLGTLTFVNSNLGFLADKTIFRRTTDGGRSWTEVEIAPQTVPIRPDPPTFGFGSPSFFDDLHGLVEVDVREHDGSVMSASIFRTDDAGASWSLVLRDDLHRSWMFIDAEHWIAVDGTTVWTASGAGQTITSATSTGLPRPLGLATGTFVDPLHGWVSAVTECPPGRFCALIANQLYKTSDGGRTWTTVGDCDTKGGVFACASAAPG